MAAGKAYPCFCTDEELEAMKKDAEVRGRGFYLGGSVAALWRRWWWLSCLCVERRSWRR